jgi:NADPH:quinone reductase-like Zn-dependent oxidoreductase
VRFTTEGHHSRASASQAKEMQMKAITQDAYGSVDQLALRDIDIPTIGADEVLVRVKAAGVDPGVWHLMTGRPYLVRCMGLGFRHPKVPVRGRDLSGVIESVGANVQGLRPGDEVYGTSKFGSFAEYARTGAADVAPKPAALTFEQAAVVPISGMTALQAVRDVGGLEAGQHVLVIGAAGGVGSFAVQIAQALGARVTGMCSTAKLDFVRSLGADEVMDYTSEEVDSRTQFDLIVDTGGRRPVSLLRRALTPTGTLAIVGGEGGGRWLGGFDRQILRAPFLSLFSDQRLRPVTAKERRADLEYLTELIDDGKITPAIDRTYAISDAAEAISFLAEGHPSGKVAVSIR